LVQVNWYRGPDEPPNNPCWDSHTQESARLKTVLVPPTDQAYSALLEDLDRRGLLDETLVVCMAEFGRSPRLDGNGGRNHWGSVFSVTLAGGGVRGGQVYGSSDKIGAYPREGKVRPEDLSATIFHCLGHAPQTEYLDPLGRPHPVSRGEVLHAIL
jgi:arylsulfatase A-like enzyme